jgi:hypothetical protein
VSKWQIRRKIEMTEHKRNKYSSGDLSKEAPRMIELEMCF